MDLLGKAMWDFYRTKTPLSLVSHSSLGMSEEVPVSYFFRDFAEMPTLEQTALNHCRGSILDIGCGAGSHSLFLQNRGMEVTGLDESPKALEVAAKRGLQRTVCTDILEYRVGKFDTLLLLMNGIGIAGTLEGLKEFLIHLQHLLKPGGQILLDSSDLIYLFESDEDGGVWVPGNVGYYGEVTYQWEYEDRKGNPFTWLFVDPGTLQRVVTGLGFQMELLEEGPHYDYLARLTRPDIPE